MSVKSERLKIAYTMQYEMMEKFRTISEMPVIICIGSTRVTGDCLGPIVGHLLKTNYNVPAFIYGTLEKPVTAANIEETVKFVEMVHGGKPVIAVDAAVGRADSIGEIRIYDDGIYPGLAAGKVLSKVGTHSIIGVVEEKSYFGANLLLSTRFGLVSELAETIALAVNDFLMLIKSRSMITGQNATFPPQISGYC